MYTWYGIVRYSFSVEPSLHHSSLFQLEQRRCGSCMARRTAAVLACVLVGLAAAAGAESEIDAAIGVARSGVAGDAARARDILGPLVAAGRGGFDAAVALGAACGELGEGAAAAAAYARACEIDGGGVALAAAAAALRAGRPREAAAAAAAAVAADATLLEARVIQGNALLAAGSPREALAAFAEALGGGGVDPAAHAGAGHASVALRQPDAAAGHFAAAAAAADAAARGAPADADAAAAAAAAWLNLGSALHDAGRLAAAEEALATAVARAAPDGAGPALLALGMARKDAGDMYGAGAAFMRAARAPRSPPDAHVALVWALMELGRIDDAAAALRAGMRAAPEYPWWPYIAQIKLLRGGAAGAAGVGEEFARMLAAAREAGTPDGAAAFAALALKHFVCAPLDGVLNDKARCARALRAAASVRGVAAFDVHAETYLMPGEAGAFLAAAAAAGPGARWLQKPAWGANGWGVGFVADAPAAARSLGAGWIVQRYLEDPLLLDGHKFDLRVFVTVASARPLRAYVHRHGWANIADAPYAAGAHTSHVTNAAFLEGLPHDARACRKWSTARVMRAVAAAAAARGMDGAAAAASVWAGVKDVVARTVIAGLYDTGGACADGFDGCNATAAAGVCAHKTFGFDVLVQQSPNNASGGAGHAAPPLRVWLIEVNRGPGFDFEGRLFCDEPPMAYDAFAASLATVMAMSTAGAGGAAGRACAATLDTSALPPEAAGDVAREMGHASASGEVELVAPLMAFGSCAPGVPCTAAQAGAAAVLDLSPLLPQRDAVETQHTELLRHCWPPAPV